MSFPKFTRRQILIGAAVVVGLAFLGGIFWAFGRQISLAQQLRVEEKRLEQLVATEQARHEALTAQLTYVESDEYVERWARVEAKMARPGEVVVVSPLEDNGLPPSGSEPQPVSSVRSSPFWVVWWHSIVGSPAD
jgi:cell division protein FtsB